MGYVKYFVTSKFKMYAAHCFSFCFHQYNITELWQEIRTNREGVKQIIEKVLGKYTDTIHSNLTFGRQTQEMANWPLHTVGLLTTGGENEEEEKHFTDWVHFIDPCTSLTESFKRIHLRRCMKKRTNYFFFLENIRKTWQRFGKWF